MTRYLTRQTNMDLKICKAQKLHNNKYDYSKVFFRKMIDKITIICPDHGEFFQTMHKHLQGDGCKKCGIIQHGKSKISKAKDSFLHKSKNIHGDKYDYSMVEYKNAKSLIRLICQIHGEFEISPNKHLSGAGCQKCGRNIISRKLMYPLEKYLEEVNHIYGFKYDYSNIVWEGTDKKILINCPKHNIEFSTLAKDHRDRGVECKECKKEKQIPIYNQLTTEKFVENSKKIWGDKYDYTKTVYTNMNTKVIIICKTHGEFLQLPSNHYKYDCYKCNNKSFSKVSLEWLQYCEIKYNCKIQHALNLGEYKIPNTSYRADGYCEETNTIFEFYGDFYHGNPKIFYPTDINPFNSKSYKELYEKTLNREKELKKLGYNIITIWENDWEIFIKKIKKIQKLFRLKRKL